MAQTDFKKLVAYSSVSHMGYVMLGMAAFHRTGIEGAALQMFNHGTLVRHALLHRGRDLRTRPPPRPRPLRRHRRCRMPWYTGIATVGFFASLGLPA